MCSEWIASLALLLAGGCVASRAADRAVDHASDSASELDFWQRLETQSLLSNHDALHGLLLLADGKDDRASFAERLEEARRRGWIGAGDSIAPDETAAVGLVCVALCDLLALRGGVTTRLAPRSWRYCTREVVAAGLLPDRTEAALRGEFSTWSAAPRTGAPRTGASRERPLRNLARAGRRRPRRAQRRRPRPRPRSTSRRQAGDAAGPGHRRRRQGGVEGGERGEVQGGRRERPARRRRGDSHRPALDRTGQIHLAEKPRQLVVGGDERDPARSGQRAQGRHQGGAGSRGSDHHANVSGIADQLRSQRTLDSRGARPASAGSRVSPRARAAASAADEQRSTSAPRSRSVSRVS
jgi:hypothetical protein